MGGCTCSKLDRRENNRRKYPYRNTSNPRPNVEAFGGSETRDDASVSPTGFHHGGFSDHGASVERARSLGEETVNTGETSSTYVRSPAAIALTARYHSTHPSAHPSVSPTPGSARTHHVNFSVGSQLALNGSALNGSSSTVPSPYATGKGPVYINGTPDGVVTVDEADAPSPSPPSSSSDTSDSDADTETSSAVGSSVSGGDDASPTRREGTSSQPRDVTSVPAVIDVDPSTVASATAGVATTPARGAAVGRGSSSITIDLSIPTSPPSAAAAAGSPSKSIIAGSGLTSPNPLRGGSADREVELAVAASTTKKAKKVEPVLAPLETPGTPTVALVNQTPRKVALDEDETSSGDDEEVDDDGVDVSPPDSPLTTATSVAASPKTADAVEEQKVARAISVTRNSPLEKEKKKSATADPVVIVTTPVTVATTPVPTPPTVSATETTKLLSAHVGPIKSIQNEEDQAWQNLCRRHTTGVTAVLRATREEFNRLSRQLEDQQQRGRKAVETDSLGAIGRIRREFEEKVKANK